MTRVLVCGAGGKMGREVVRAIWTAPDLELVGAVDISAAGQAISDLLGDVDSTLAIVPDLQDAINQSRPDVVVDFTSPKAVYQNAQIVLNSKVNLVVGTTGLTAEERSHLNTLAKASEVGALVAPNFALGAVLMMQMAELAARYLPNVEIIELHHNHKYDAPSGTSKLTAEKIAAARNESPAGDQTRESLTGARGARVENIQIHSIRLPGYVAHQEILFGGTGETLTLRHDSLDRRSFMPGVLLACRRVIGRSGLTYGLEHYL